MWKKFMNELKNKENLKKGLKISLMIFAVKEIVGLVVMFAGLV